MDLTIWRFILCLAIVDLLIFKTCQGMNAFKSVEKALIRKLLNRYEHHGIFGRPVNDSQETVVVEHKLQLIQILDLDENRQILVTNCWSNLRWQDSIIKWDPNEYSNITVIRVNPYQIWTPDIMLYNFADERLEEKRECRVKVSYTGEILWIPQSLFKSSCAVEITYFPFDTQTCKLEFGSLTYDQRMLDITWWMTNNESDTYIDYLDYMPSNEWQTDGEPDFKKIKGNEQIQSRKIYRLSTSNSASNKKLLYPILRYLLKLHRNPSFYITILVVPCSLLSLLTLVIFWLPPESPAKLMLGISIFVAFFVLLLLLADCTPKEVKNFPLIGAYFCLNMMMITMTTFLATVIINLHFKGSKTGAVPKIIRRIVIDGLGSLVFISKNINLPSHKTLQQNYIKRIGSNVNIKKHNSVWIRNTDQKFRKKIINNVNIVKSMKSDPKPPDPRQSERCYNYIIENHVTFARDIREIKRYIRIFIDKEKTEISKNLIAMEYRTLALVLDRLFFILYISIIVIAVVVCYSNTEISELEVTRNITSSQVV